MSFIDYRRKGHLIGEFAYKPIEAKGATFDIKIGELSRQRQGYGKAALEKACKGLLPKIALIESKSLSILQMSRH